VETQRGNIQEKNTSNSVTTTSISVFPNPVKDGMINLQCTRIKSGDYQVNIMNQQGSLVDSRTLKLKENEVKKTIAINGLSSGSYILTMKGYNGEIFHSEFLVL